MNVREKLRMDLEAAMALVAVVVGAGFASGREVLRFFTAFGPWSWINCFVAAAALAGLSGYTALLSARLSAKNLAALSQRALGGKGGVLASILLGALVAATAGAMLAAMGELARLALPLHGAYYIGIFASLLMAALLAGRGLPALAMVGAWLVPACLLLYALIGGLEAPASKPIALTLSGARAIPYALFYAAMNAALGCGTFCELGTKRSRRDIARMSLLAGGILLCLLLFANRVLMPYRETMQDEALPAVQLARGLGALGYWLCLITLSLAVMTTLIALFRTLFRMLAPFFGKKISGGLMLALPLLIALIGFDALVGNVYPVLGAASTLLFVAVVVKGGR